MLVKPKPCHVTGFFCINQASYSCCVRHMFQYTCEGLASRSNSGLVIPTLLLDVGSVCVTLLHSVATNFDLT